LDRPRHLDWDALEIPYRWKKPRTVFVCSMADLFHEKVPADFILRVWSVMGQCPDHTFLILTKRAKRMQRFVTDIQIAWGEFIPCNVWLGVTAENQEMADLRIPYLLQTPAAVRGVSVEPMLGAIDLTELKDSYKTINALRGWRSAPTCHEQGQPKLDWVIIGAESGPNARMMKGQWAKDLISQCDAAGVPVFVKQISKIMGVNKIGVSKDPSEWQEALRRKEWPG